MARTRRGRRAVRPIQVRAAGGIVVRPSKKGAKVLLIHRPRYNDWSFPKGKVDPGESFKQAARREVLEETGFRCKLHKPRLPSMAYKDRFRRDKEVRYWLMTVEDGEFVPNAEVDEIAWVRVDKVLERLSFRRDQVYFHLVLQSGRIDELVSSLTAGETSAP